MAPPKAIGVSFFYHYTKDHTFDVAKFTDENANAVKNSIAPIIAKYAVLPLSAVKVDFFGGADPARFGVYATLMAPNIDNHPTDESNVISYLQQASSALTTELSSNVWSNLQKVLSGSSQIHSYLEVESLNVISRAVSVSFPITGLDYSSMTALHKFHLRFRLSLSIAQTLNVPRPAVTVELSPGRVDAAVLTSNAISHAHYVGQGIGGVTLKMMVERDVRNLVYNPFAVAANDPTDQPAAEKHDPSAWDWKVIVNMQPNMVEPVLWDGVVAHPPDVAIAVDVTQIQGKVLETISGLGDWLKHHGIVAKHQKAVNFLTNAGADHVSEAFATLQRGREFLDALDLLPLKKKRVLADMTGGNMSLA